jgi:hypothetical protein
MLLENLIDQLLTIIDSAHIKIGHCQKGFDEGMIRLSRTGFSKCGECLLILVAIGQYPAPIVTSDHDIAWTELYQSVILLKRAVIKTIQPVEHPGHNEDRWVIRRLPSHLGQCGKRLVLLTSIEVNIDHLQMRSWNVRIQFNGSL